MDAIAIENLGRLTREMKTLNERLEALIEATSKSIEATNTENGHANEVL